MLPMMAIQNRFKIKPTLAISSCFTLPVANTIAFGGVAIGNINAQLAPQAIIAAKAIGGKFMDCATEIKMRLSQSKVPKAVWFVQTERCYPP